MKRFLFWIVGCICMASCQQDMDAPWEDKLEQSELVQSALPAEQTEKSEGGTQIEFQCGHNRAVFEKPHISGLEDVEMDWGDGMQGCAAMHDYGTLEGEETHVFSLKGKGDGSIHLRRMDGIQSITIRRDTL